MIEARFDDLTGDEPSFRLVEPVGVLEAHTLAEVEDVVAAAEKAAARGLWVAGYVAYEAAPGLDPSLVVRERDPADAFSSMPLVWFAMFEGRQETTLPEPQDTSPPPDPGAWAPSVDRDTYDSAIARIREHIAAGDTYQVNHTIRLSATIDGDARGLYRDLCFSQRGRYCAYLDIGRFRVLSASPELFFRMDGSKIESRPMKGTAPRGRFLAEDGEIRDALLGSAKDRAENAMIVDLIRNDLSRVAKRGSVSWSDVFDAERYETVWQLTSRVSAELDPRQDLVGVFRALFPCGSVTGAPKVSTMKITADLEDSPRGVYCGAVGYLSPTSAPGPRARFNVAIRTVVQDASTGLARYGVGGGITWDSSAAAEYDEVVAKARVLTWRRPAFRLLETLAWEPGTGYRRLKEHLERLRDSASWAGFAFEEASVVDALDAIGQGGTPLRVRLLLDRSGRLETGAAPLSRTATPVRLAIDSSQPVDPADPFLFHKTTLRERYASAAARHPDADDVVLVNIHGEVTETTRANIAVLLGGRWVTPLLGCGLLPGCERAALLAEGKLIESSVSLDDLRSAEQIAYLSSVRGFNPAVLLDRT
jgi:para-aminobenzoate synthetase/4-amino-4-deoxychorismate lyase